MTIDFKKLSCLEDFQHVMENLSHMSPLERKKELSLSNEIGSTLPFFILDNRYDGFLEDLTQCFKWDANINQRNEVGSLFYYLNYAYLENDLKKKNKIMLNMLEHPDFKMDKSMIEENFFLIFEKDVSYPKKLKKAFLNKIDEQWHLLDEKSKLNTFFLFSIHELEFSPTMKKDLWSCAQYLLKHPMDLGAESWSLEKEHPFFQETLEQFNRLFETIYQSRELPAQEAWEIFFSKLAFMIHDFYYAEHGQESIFFSPMALKLLKVVECLTDWQTDAIELQDDDIKDKILALLVRSFQPLYEPDNMTSIKAFDISEKIAKKYNLNHITVHNDFINYHQDSSFEIIDEFLKECQDFFGSPLIPQIDFIFQNEQREGRHSYGGVMEHSMNPLSAQIHIKIIFYGRNPEKIIHEYTHAIQYNYHNHNLGISHEHFFKLSPVWKKIKDQVFNFTVSQEQLGQKMISYLLESEIKNTDKINQLSPLIFDFNSPRASSATLKSILSECEIPFDNWIIYQKQLQMFCHAYKRQHKFGFQHGLWDYLDKKEMGYVYYNDDYEIHARLNEQLYIQKKNIQEFFYDRQCYLFNPELIFQVEPFLKKFNEQLIGGTIELEKIKKPKLK